MCSLQNFQISITALTGFCIFYGVGHVFVCVLREALKLRLFVSDLLGHGGKFVLFFS